MNALSKKIYIASLYSRRQEMEDYANELTAAGFEITSSWVYGGEDGKSNEDIAILDFKDVDAADLVLSFTLPHGSIYKGGGRHVEFGYGLAKDKISCLVGDRENVFHWHPSVRQFDTIDEFIAAYT